MTAYEMRISDWSADVCSSDRVFVQRRHAAVGIEREIFGAAMLARGHVDEDRFVLQALFEQRDQHASRVRRKRVVMQADHRQRSWSCGAADHSAAVCGASGAIRTQAAFGICAYRKTSQTNSAAIMHIGRASCREEWVSSCRSRWSPYQ